MIVWLNDNLIDTNEARIDPAERGFLLGDGLFETLAMRAGKILRLESHLARLKTGCAVLQLPYPEFDIGVAMERTCIANQIADAVIRLTLARGPAQRGVMPPPKPQTTLLIAVTPWAGAPPPARCILASVTRRNEHSPLSSIKSTNYLDNILAAQEAASRGANEAILLNTAGRVVESTVANIFIVKNNKVTTPPVSEGALPGVMRAAVLDAYKGAQAPIEIDDLRQADGIFLTNSLGIRMVTSLDGKTTGNAARPFIEDIRLKFEPG